MLKIRGWKNSWRQLSSVNTEHESVFFKSHELLSLLITPFPCLFLFDKSLSRDVHLFLVVHFNVPRLFWSLQVLEAPLNAHGP